MGDAPVRFGLVSFSLVGVDEQIHGSVTLKPHPNGTLRRNLRCTVRLISPKWARGAALSGVEVTTGEAALIALHPENSTAVFSVDAIADGRFDFTANFTTERSEVFV